MKTFNSKLFWDTFRRIRLTGIAFAAFSIVIALLPVVAMFIAQLQNPVGRVYAPSIGGVASVLIFTMYVGGAALIYHAFSFLNKRNASDFYGSIPMTRSGAYISIAAGALAWSYAIVIATVLAVWAAHGIFGLVFNIMYVPCLLGSYLAGITLVSGAALIAVCASGTRFGNMVLTAIVLFYPRAILYICDFVASRVAVIVPSGELGWFFQASINIPAGMALSVFNAMWGTGMAQPYDLNMMLSSGGSMAYTFVLGVMLVLAGMLLYKRRRSEIAGMNAPSKLLQHVYRCLIGLPLVLILTALIVTSGWAGIGSAGSIVMISISLLGYLLYELATTKKLKNVLRALPVFLVPVAFSVAVCLISAGAGKAMLRTHAPAEQIEYVQRVLNSNRWRQDQRSYNIMLIEQMRYNNADINRILSENLDKAIESIDSRDPNGTGFGGSQFAIKLKNGRTLNRMVPIASAAEYSGLEQLFYEYPGSASGARDLPQGIDSVSVAQLDSKVALALWETYKQEFALLSDSDAYSLNGMSNYIFTRQETTPELASKTLSYIFGDAQLIVAGHIGAEKYTSVYKISQLTPRTFEACLQALNAADAKNFESLRSKLTGAVQDEFVALRLTAQKLNPGPDDKEIWLDIALPTDDAIRKTALSNITAMIPTWNSPNAGDTYIVSVYIDGALASAQATTSARRVFTTSDENSINALQQMMDEFAAAYEKG